MHYGDVAISQAPPGRRGPRDARAARVGLHVPGRPRDTACADRCGGLPAMVVTTARSCRPLSHADTSAAAQFHAVPFQCSTSGLALMSAKVFVLPTAHALPPDAAYTPTSIPPPAGSGRVSRPPP